MKKYISNLWFRIRSSFIVAKNQWKLTNPRNFVRPFVPLTDSLDDYADHQIAALLVAIKEYKQAQKDPKSFVEKYFSHKLTPIPYKDSWAYDLVHSSCGDLGGFEFNWNIDNGEKINVDNS